MMNFDQKTPIYLQLATHIREAILAGDLPEGEAIPSVRQLSVEQSLNPQTVLNATQLLIQEGLLEKRRGLGYFVLPGAQQQLQEDDLERFKQELLPALVEQAQRLGLSASDLIKLVQSAYRKGGQA